MLIDSAFAPNVKNQDKDFLHMADALVSGMWVMHPILDTQLFLYLLYNVLNLNVTNNNVIPQIELDLRTRFNLFWLNTVLRFVKYSPVRGFYNLLQYITFWLMKHFPFLAYYQYGYSRSHVATDMFGGAADKDK